MTPGIDQSAVDVALLTAIAEQFETDARGSLKMAEQVERRFGQWNEFPGDRAKAGHYRKNAGHFADRGIAVRAALEVLANLRAAEEQAGLVRSVVDAVDPHTNDRQPEKPNLQKVVNAIAELSEYVWRARIIEGRERAAAASTKGGSV